MYKEKTFQEFVKNNCEQSHMFINNFLIEKFNDYCSIITDFGIQMAEYFLKKSTISNNIKSAIKFYSLKH